MLELFCEFDIESLLSLYS